MRRGALDPRVMSDVVGIESDQKDHVQKNTLVRFSCKTEFVLLDWSFIISCEVPSTVRSWFVDRDRD